MTAFEMMTSDSVSFDLQWSPLELFDLALEMFAIDDIFVTW